MAMALNLGAFAEIFKRIEEIKKAAGAGCTESQKAFVREQAKSQVKQEPQWKLGEQIMGAMYESDQFRSDLLAVVEKHKALFESGFSGG